MPQPTVFSLLMNLCGLKQREAAELLDVSLDTIKSWCTSKQGRAPEYAIAKLRKYFKDAVDCSFMSFTNDPYPVMYSPFDRLCAAVTLSRRTDYPALKVIDAKAPEGYIKPTETEERV